MMRRGETAQFVTAETTLGCRPFDDLLLRLQPLLGVGPKWQFLRQLFIGDGDLLLQCPLLGGALEVIETEQALLLGQGVLILGALAQILLLIGLDQGGIRRPGRILHHFLKAHQFRLDMRENLGQRPLLRLQLLALLRQFLGFPGVIGRFQHRLA